MAGPTKQLAKASEAYYALVLKQQELQKKFVAEKNVAKKESMKKQLIDLHKQVKTAEAAFNNALASEPIEDLEEITNENVKTFVKEHAFRTLVRKKIAKLVSEGKIKLVNKKTIKEAIKLIKESINEQKKKSK